MNHVEGCSAHYDAERACGCPCHDDKRVDTHDAEFNAPLLDEDPPQTAEHGLLRREVPA